MPQILRNIECIAEEKQRDVLLVCFGQKPSEWPFLRPPIDKWKASLKSKRKQFVAWLDEHAIGHEDCYPPAAFTCIAFPYDGSLYIDLPFDAANSAYQSFISKLENADGTPRDPEMVCFFMKLEVALQKIAHAAKDTDWL